MQWFDCVEKKSLVKESNYDYEINTSQDYAKEEKKASMEAYEESDNGFCPKNCGRCNEKKVCLKSKKTCNLIDPNCSECTEDNKYCTKCKNNLYLYQNKCYEIKTSLINKYNKVKTCSQLMTGCQSCILENVCIKPYDGYGIDYDTMKPKKLGIYDKKYYFDSKDSTYKKCTHGVANCQFCTSSSYCFRCNSGYFLIGIDNNNYDHSRCYTSKDVYLSSYYNKNTTHRPLCSSKISGCYSCNSQGTKCYSCLTGYQWYKKNCVRSNLISSQCGVKFPHCNICNSANTKCESCKGGYTLLRQDRYGKCYPYPEQNTAYFDEKKQMYIKCLNSPYLEQCFKCKDAYTCIECDTKAHIMQDGKCIRISN